MKRLTRSTLATAILGAMTLSAPMAVDLSPPESSDASIEQSSAWVPVSGFQPELPETTAPIDPRQPAIPVTGNNFRADLLSLIDMTLEYAKDGGLPVYFVEKLEQDRQTLNEISITEFDELAPSLGLPVSELSRVTSWLDPRLPIPAVEDPADKSAGLPGANYPNVSWSFFLDATRGTPGGNAGDERRSGVCSLPRTNPNLQFTSLNAVLLNEAIRDVSDQICNQSALGANLSLACIVTDIAYLVQRGIFDNLILCEDLIDDAEVEGSFKRLGHLHGDLENAEANLKHEVDSAEMTILNQVQSSQTAIQNQLTAAENALKSEIDANEALINQVLAALGAANDRLAEIEAVQRQMIKLLLTPQGNRFVNPEVLTCVGAACPNVLDCPGEECTFPIGPMPQDGAL